MALALRWLLVCFGVLIGGEAAADGLERFQREVLPRLTPGTLSFGKATAHGPSGVVLEDVSFNPSARDGSREVYRVARVTIEEIDLDGVAASGIARFGKLQMTGVRLPENASYVGFLRSNGVLPTASDIRLEFRYEGHTLTVTRLEIVAAGLARLSGDVVLEGVRAPISDVSKLYNEASIRSAHLTYEDRSALGRAIGAGATRSGKPQETVQREWQAGIGNLARHKGPQTAAALDAVASLVEDHRRPKGPLRLTIAPSKPMPLRMVALLMLGSDVAKSVGLTVAYAGARSRAAAATP
jgi:hypothetical protein